MQMVRGNGAGVGAMTEEYMTEEYQTDTLVEVTKRLKNQNAMAEHLGISMSALVQLANNDKIPGVGLVSGEWLFDCVAVEAALIELAQPKTKTTKKRRMR